MKFLKWYLIRIHLSKLDGVLEGFAIETKKDFKFKTLNIQSPQSESNIVPSDSVVVSRDGEEITIRDPRMVKK